MTWKILLLQTLKQIQWVRNDSFRFYTYHFTAALAHKYASNYAFVDVQEELIILMEKELLGARKECFPTVPITSFSIRSDNNHGMELSG
jgi:hypothetical protein